MFNEVGNAFERSVRDTGHVWRSAAQDTFDVIPQGEQFEVSPATHLLSQAMVLGDRRTFSLYDLTQQITFGTVRSLNLHIRWKSSEGEWPSMRNYTYL